MRRLPPASGREAVKALRRVGFEIVGRKGSHIRLKKKTDRQVFIVIVPDHRELARGTLISIIQQSGLTREEFLKMLKH